MNNQSWIPKFKQLQADWNQSDNSAIDFVKNKPTRVVANSVVRTISTTASTANGYIISSAKDAIANYSITISVPVQIGGTTNANGYVLLEASQTNSSSQGDWTEIGRGGIGHNIGLAAALSSTITAPLQICGVIPAGYFARLRSVNVAGALTYTYNYGQEVLI